jgi:hypothetical protein
MIEFLTDFELRVIRHKRQDRL